MSQSALLGRYVLLQRLAVGGMAELFLAKAVRHDGAEEICVVKRVLPHLARDPAFVRMFLDEARVAALLRHPGIVQLFDFGRLGPDSFYAMEYLAGEDLAAVIAQSAIAQTPVPVPIAALVIARAAEALHAAHEASGADGRPLKLVHRDVSPANLFVTYQGTVKVLDFGVARTSGDRLEETAAGQLKGKVAYMAPEQLEGAALDRRVDVWALGACLYELLTGKRSFSRVRAIGGSVEGAAAPLPAPSRHRHDVPEELSAIVLQALDPDPARRFQTAEALQRALEAFAGPQVAPLPLAAFLRSLFGEQRALEKLQRGTAPDGAAVSGPTAVPRDGDATELDPGGVRRPWLQRPGWKSGAAVAAAALAVVLFTRFHRASARVLPLPVPTLGSPPRAAAPGSPPIGPAPPQLSPEAPESKVRSSSKRSPDQRLREGGEQELHEAHVGRASILRLWVP